MVQTRERNEEQIVVKLNNRLDRDYLVWEACQTYNQSKNAGDPVLTKDSNPLYVQRICVNYLRHRASNYEELLRQYGGGQFTNGQIRDRIRQKVYAAIADAYPWLKAECDRQLSLRRYS